MAKMRIEGKEHPIGAVFSKQFSFNIPLYSLLLKAIEDKDDLYADKSPLQLTQLEQVEIKNSLDDLLYLVHQNPRNYVMRRLDAALSDGEAQYDLKNFSIEHVLPQTPKADSQWCKDFNEEQRLRWTNRLGNLVLLSRKKNSQAQNYEFDVKKESYFKVKSVSPFALTTQVLTEKSWTPSVVEALHGVRLKVLCDLWQLK